MSDPEQPVPKQDQPTDFDQLADAPLEALGLASSAAAALKQALGIQTVRELADHRLIRRAQAIVNLAGPRR
jgi:pantoate kinase